MLDVYTQITDASAAILDRLMTVLDRRAADPQQRACSTRISLIRPSLREHACSQAAVAMEEVQHGCRGMGEGPGASDCCGN